MEEKRRKQQSPRNLSQQQQQSPKVLSKTDIQEIEHGFFKTLDDAIRNSKLNNQQLRGIANMLSININKLESDSQLRNAIISYLISIKHTYAPNKFQLVVGGTALASAYYFVSLVAWMVTISARYISDDWKQYAQMVINPSTEKELHEVWLLGVTPPIIWFICKVGLAFFGSYVLLFKVFTAFFPTMGGKSKTKKMILEAINFADANAVSEEINYTEEKLREICGNKNWLTCGWFGKGKLCKYNYRERKCDPSVEAIGRAMFRGGIGKKSQSRSP